MTLKVPMQVMYFAGKTDIPAQADHVAQVSSRLHQALQVFDKQAAAAGDPAVMRSMLGIGGDVYEQLRRAVTSLNHCAEAVIKTADDFRRVDDDAREDYRHLGSHLKTVPIDPAHRPPALVDPGAPGATYDLPPGPYPPGSSLTLPSTEDPDRPEADEAERDETEQDLEDDNPVVRPESSDR